MPVASNAISSAQKAGIKVERKRVCDTGFYIDRNQRALIIFLALQNRKQYVVMIEIRTSCRDRLFYFIDMTIAQNSIGLN